ncbi:hypothetical protein CANCADRAFT_573 [Tortispora caseinolytica NRRL Y-17796]|uniref:MPN domain-containing protein n=1 Tax=Tortispora caseinolytica NRRL Y-17796 TaxID=767744 RepID=A0A1E4TJT8_9ASCO|nr:hypothetical protein CANCADRAFT_573 [Tortispora caseinolytica NRRL Y-17796]
MTSIGQSVAIAPLVLLSTVDHYNRTARGTKKRVVGVLLGTTGPVYNVTNSFAVPFEEDEKDGFVWFLDHNYIESMASMFRKVNAKEQVIGWYHSGPKLRASDMAISELLKRFTAKPVLVIIDVFAREEIPTDAYFAIDEVKDDGSTTSRTFVHAPSTIVAEEAEEIGVEHLLRDVRDAAIGALSTRVTAQLQSLRGLQERLADIANYLTKVYSGKLPINHAILGHLQGVFNLLPNLSPIIDKSDKIAGDENPLTSAMRVHANDELMTVYLSSLVRAITAFHNLIENKIQIKGDAKSSSEKSADSSNKLNDDADVNTNGPDSTAKSDAQEKPKDSSS